MPIFRDNMQHEVSYMPVKINWRPATYDYETVISPCLKLTFSIDHKICVSAQLYDGKSLKYLNGREVKRLASKLPRPLKPFRRCHSRESCLNGEMRSYVDVVYFFDPDVLPDK